MHLPRAVAVLQPDVRITKPHVRSICMIELQEATVTKHLLLLLDQTHMFE